MRRRMVARRRDGTYVLALDDDQRAMLAALADQLDPLLDDPSADPGLRRLFPPARTDDLLAEAQWEIEQGAQLRDSRRAALEVVRTAGTDPISEDELVAWVQGINAVRLVLAERLGVDGDDDADEASWDDAIARAEDPTLPPAERDQARRLVQLWAVYGLLAQMLGHAVEALG